MEFSKTEFTHNTSTRMTSKLSQTAPAREARSKYAAARRQAEDIVKDAPPKERPKPRKRNQQHSAQQATNPSKQGDLTIIRGGSSGGYNRGRDERDSRYDEEDSGGFNGEYTGYVNGEKDSENDGENNSKNDGESDSENNSENNSENDGENDGENDNEFNGKLGGKYKSGQGEYRGRHSGNLAGSDEYGSEPEQYGQHEQEGKPTRFTTFYKLLMYKLKDTQDLSIEEIDEGDLLVPFDIPVDEVNHTMDFTLDTAWEDFEWEVTQKLNVSPVDMSLSYKLASQTKAEMARALVSKKDFEGLIHGCKPFIDGTKKCPRGKEFRVQLLPKITVKKEATVQPQNKKVCSPSCGDCLADEWDRERPKGRPLHLAQRIMMRGMARKLMRAIKLVRCSRRNPAVRSMAAAVLYCAPESMCASFQRTSLNGQR